MQDPCDPTPHHAHTIVHHHPPGQVIGRIRRHGTHRIARRLHAIAGACGAGPPLVVGAATLKAVAPAAAFVGLTTIASHLTAPDDAFPQGEFPFVGATGIGPGAGPGAVGVAPHKTSHPHHPPVSVPEPPSLTLLLVVTLGWIGLRLGLRRVTRKRP